MANPQGSPASARSRDRSFARIEVRTPDRDSAERLAAEAYEAGAVGLEEREQAGGIALIIYAPQVCVQAVARALREHAGADARVCAPEPLPVEDWAETWKAGLRPIDVSPRLRIRPSFAEAAAAGGQGRGKRAGAPVELGPQRGEAERSAGPRSSHGRAAGRSSCGARPSRAKRLAAGSSPAASPLRPAELVIDPGQAFGTGSHASTRLALEWIDRLAPGLAPGSRVLDVGCGTGVLALAALRLSHATRGVGLDLDPEAARASRANAQRNALAERLDVVLGTLDALRETAFTLVVANLLRTELLPLAGEIARRTAPGGFAVLSGLLESERGDVERALARAGLAARDARSANDGGGDVWLALLTSR